MMNSAQHGAGAYKYGPMTADPIALALQRLYTKVETEALPDRFMDLLDALDALDEPHRIDQRDHGGSGRGMA